MKKFLFFLLGTSPIHALDYFSIATGVFDLCRERHRTWEFEMEYKFLLKWLQPPNPHLNLRPLVGTMATVRGSAYLYVGLNFDLLLNDRLLLAPGLAAGGYWQGEGKNLGYPIELRSGIELAWRFAEGSRFGIHFYHLSNAGLSKRNPGSESLVIYYDIPVNRLFYPSSVGKPGP